MAKLDHLDLEKVSNSESDVMKSAQAAANLFREFITSSYEGGFVRPLTSINQLAGIRTAPKKEEELHGGMKAAHRIGNATGEILDVVLLNKLAGGAVSKLARELPPESIAGAALLSHRATKAVLTSGAAGFVNGAFLTPVAEGEGSGRRLGNGIANGAAFAMLGGVRAGYAKTFGDGLAARVAGGALSGAAGGATESTLDPITHGKSPELRAVATSMASWALGNVVAGESMRSLSQGIRLSQISSESVPTTEELTASLKEAGKGVGTPKAAKSYYAPSSAEAYFLKKPPQLSSIK